jgi:hypothetical protein
MKKVGTLQDKQDWQSLTHSYHPHKSRGPIRDILKGVLKWIWKFDKMDKFLGM